MEPLGLTSKAGRWERNASDVSQEVINLRITGELSTPFPEVLFTVELDRENFHRWFWVISSVVGEGWASLFAHFLFLDSGSSVCEGLDLPQMEAEGQTNRTSRSREAPGTLCGNNA